MNAFAGPLFPMISEMYPDATYMFNTRLPVGTMASYAQIVNHIPIIAKGRFFYNVLQMFLILAPPSIWSL